MVLNPVSLTVRVVGDAVEIVVDEKTIPVDRVARAFPKTHPHSHISFLDKLGHEIGLLEKLDGLEQESRSVLEEHLKKIYFVPEIEEILSVKTTGTTSRWTVVTEEGERSFQVLGRESIDGDKAPALPITEADSSTFVAQPPQRRHGTGASVPADEAPSTARQLEPSALRTAQRLASTPPGVEPPRRAPPDTCASP